MLNPHIFRAYDVRGRVGNDINPEVFRQVGRAYATLIRDNSGRTVAIGQDNRESSAGLKAAFTEGVRAAGVNVIDIGEVTTPMLYFATAHWGLDGGANITGSHNPVDYNGVKMVHPGAAPLSEDEIQMLRTRIESGDLASGSGTLTSRNPRDDYFATLAAPGPPGPAAARGRRRRQRRGGPLRAGATPPHRLRRHRAALRVRRALPQPPARPRGPRQRRRPAGQGRRGRAPTSAWPGTATPTASA